MPPTLLVPIALFVLSLAAASLTYWVRRNDATTKETLAEVRELARLTAKVHQTVFGPEGGNGLNGDTGDLKKTARRVNAFIQFICLLLNLECDDEGATKMLHDESPFERRLIDRRQTRDRRASDQRVAPHSA